MTRDPKTADPALRLAQVLRAENQALAAGDSAAVQRLLPEKQAAAAGLRTALPDPVFAAALRDLAAENGARLALAIEVQGRVLELVARAARMAAPGAVRYGARGGAAAETVAMALAMRA